MLTIRLARVGRENLKHFRLVVQEKARSPKAGKVVAVVGSYDPTNPENKLDFDAEKIERFIQNGAQPSDTVARLLLKNGFKKELVGKFVEKYAKQKSKDPEAAKEEPAATAAKPAEKAAPAEAEKLAEEAAEPAAAEAPTEPAAE